MGRKKMFTKKTLIKTYIEDISKLIPNNYPNKTKILKKMKQDLQLHIRESPSASWNTILDDFGSPAEIIESLISEYSGTDINNNLQKKRRQVILLFIFCILFLFFSFASLGYMYYQENYQKPYKNESQYILENGNTIPLEKMQLY